ncbi:MAG: glycerol-3-phosphate dehydrogenase [Chloroflexota bacterium]|nr:glycerol-3-phosphate dehydrogenase [Chloroflexota bacterium]
MPNWTASAAVPSTSVDLIVIGAGINGAGIARDAALRGLRVLLVDKGDIASGTTSWSSRLIHGGLRYLEHFEIGLVRESLRERERLLTIAPHLVKPLPLLLPIYKRHRHGPRLIRAGMVAYDLLSFDKSLDRHQMLSREATLQRSPGLNPEGLRSAALYFDAQVEFPERLALENALAAHAAGAEIRTYTRADEILVENKAVRGVRVTDTKRDRRQTVEARAVVNVTGPWVDHVLNTALTAPPRMIGGTKGSHIVVRPFPGAPAEALYVEAAHDGRAYFIIPWNDLYLIGTTDSRFDGDPDKVRANEEEIAYLLEETNLVVPRAKLSRGDVLYAYAGIRPLPYQDDRKEGAISRRHIVHNHAPAAAGLVSVVGGKLTTYRNLAERTVDTVMDYLGRPRGTRRTATDVLPGGAKDWPRCDAELRRDAPSWLSPGSLDHLIRVYGARAARIVALASEHRDLRSVLGPESDAIEAEVIFALESEMATTLTDVLMRRIMSGLDADAGLGSIEAAGTVAHRHFGWDQERVAQEIADFRNYVSRFATKALDDVSLQPALASEPTSHAI